ncbi:MAG: MFS transporter, partial [Mycobacteriaceae bacterium]
YLSMQIPAWVEVTEGEVPTTLSYHKDRILNPTANSDGHSIRQPLGRTILVSLWGNGTIRVLTGFLTLFIAFVAKEHDAEGIVQLAMIGLVGAAAGVGNFTGNAAGARLKLGRPAVLVLRCTAAVTIASIIVALTGNLIAVAIAALIASGASAIAKVSLDSSIQDDLPEASRASAFGRSETVLQLSWVLGGALGVLLPKELWIGFTVISVLLAIGSTQTVLTYRGLSLIPGFGGNRPAKAEREELQATESYHSKNLGKQ